jgi:SH3 domain-containing YSC84-like protein 1
VLSARTLAASAALLSFGLVDPALAVHYASPSGPQLIVDSAASAVHTLSANPNFTDLMKKSKGVVIVPTLTKGVSAAAGAGVLLAHESGHWSDPAFMSIGPVSVGTEARGKAESIVMFLMTPKAVAAFTQHDDLSIRSDANLTIVNWSPNAQGSIAKGDVVVWSGENGVFAGLDISGSHVRAGTAYDKFYYGGKLTDTKQATESHISPSNARKLMTELPS